MPAYIVILALATVIFVFAYRQLTTLTGAGDFKHRCILWFVMTLSAFLAPTFWIYAIVVMPFLVYAKKNDSNPASLYFFVLFTLPVSTIEIPGMGIIDFFFDLSNPRILALFVLLPTFIALRRQNGLLPFGRIGTDKIILAYFLLVIALLFRDTNPTNALRHMFYVFLDIFLPYFVFSRALKNMNAFRDALSSYVLAALILALIAVFEISKHWLLYREIVSALGLLEDTSTRGGYLERDGMVRAVASTLFPIVLGFVLMVGVGFYMYMRQNIQRTFMRWLAAALLAGGLIATLSRGPWVGVVVLLLVYVATGRNSVRNLMGISLAGILTLSLIAALPGGEKIINLLPYIGTTERHNIEYREQLYANSISVIQRYPWFGSTDFLETPEMEAMRQGQGIIDVVNSYLSIALRSGFVGLGLFLSIFISVLWGVYQAMRLAPDKNGEEYLLGRVLLAILLAIMTTIATVSSISFIPLVYWSVVGIGVAYTQFMSRQLSTIELGNRDNAI